MIYDKICPHGDDDVYSLSCYLCHGLISMTALTLLCVFNSCDYSRVQNRTLLSCSYHSCLRKIW